MATTLLAHDLGTTGDKATLFDEKGALLASAFAPYPTLAERFTALAVNNDREEGNNARVR
jgi:sugar (pentulose or hexulose) kinase